MNRNKDVWGEDAFEYIPERWLDNKLPSTPTLGVYGNLYADPALLPYTVLRD